MTCRRVLKLGGSLLTRDDWPNKVRAWLAGQPAALNLMIVGGGEIVEAVRKLDRQHQLGDRFAHWLCIDLLEATHRIACQLLTELPTIDRAAQLDRLLTERHTALPRTYLVQVAAFYSRFDPPADLPQDWSTTSDALAAWLARLCHADELVLFKSLDPPPGADCPWELSRLGIVDRAMVQVMPQRLPLRIVNLAT